MGFHFSKDTLLAFVQMFTVLSALGFALSIIRLYVSSNDGLYFLPWNLALAWIPLILAIILYKRTVKHGLVWSKINLVLFISWFVFLPNAFYIMTDFIHLRFTYGMRPMYDVVLLMTYSILGLALGYTSLLLVHKRTLQRFGKRGHILAVLALLASGFAIYLGRYLRWNSWDIIINPFRILFHVTERILNPSEHVLTFGITVLYFVFLGTLYWIMWQAYQLATRK